MADNGDMRGFTLSELLIALVILGLIATFTIPKVLQSQQDGRFNSIAKESAGMVSGAAQALQNNGGYGATTRFSDLTPFMNYVRVDSTTEIDDDYDGGTDNCGDGGRDCIQLHNGAMIFYKTSESFDSTDATSAIFFRLDPDGQVTASGTAGDPGMSVEFLLYYNGRIVSQRDYLPGSVSSLTTYSPDATADPPWFSWN